MADETKQPDLPVATALPSVVDKAAPGAARGIVIDPRVIVVGCLVAMLGVAVLAVFLWMVPSAAARETQAACRGLRGETTLNPALCPDGNCSLPHLAPDFTAYDNRGRPVKLSDFRGKIVLVNFWASWCGVCKTEKPKLAAMSDDLVSDDFVVIALASDRHWSDVLLAIVEALAPGAQLPEGNATVPLPDALKVYSAALPKGTPFKVFLDPPQGDDNIGQIAAAWGIKAVPESALIDRKGFIRAYFVNKRDWQSSVSETCLRSMIDGDE